MTAAEMYEQFKREAAEQGMTFEEYFDSLVTPESIAVVLDRLLTPDEVDEVQP